MKQIDDYINSLYKNTQGNCNEIYDIKNDMKAHLIETVGELKKQGKSEEESIEIAISRFGQVEEIEEQLSEVVEISKKSRVISYISVVSLLILIVISVPILVLVFKNEMGALYGTATVIIIPIYIIIRCNKLESERKKGVKLDLVLELYRLCFVSYITFLSAMTVFPMVFSSFFKLYINIIPFKTIIERIQSTISLSVILIGLLKMFILFVPLGFIAPLVGKKFKSLKTCILLGVSVYILIPLMKMLLKILLEAIGVPLFTIVIISIDYLTISILGVVVGYFIYYKLKHILPQSHV